MHLRQISLRQFRNVAFAGIRLEGRQQFFVGANGQGKTNLLEAMGFLTALRSFRTLDNRVLIGHGQPEAAIACTLDHERLGETEVTVTIRPDSKEAWLDRTRITRLTEYVGHFPTVVFSSQDIQLVRGGPALRRRWLDLTLAAMDRGYLTTLQTFTRALAERNALLKAGRPASAQLGAFERALAPAAAQLIEHRDRAVKLLNGALHEAYAHLSDSAEPAAISYAPNMEEGSPEGVLARLENGRDRDAQFRSTLAGPHRDELKLTVKGASAKDFASEGQQRSMVLALRLAQASWFREKSGVRPVLLADDVLGELDTGRRRRFWSAIDPEAQVIATGTELPDAEFGRWQVFDVQAGAVTGRVQHETPS